MSCFFAEKRVDLQPNRTRLCTCNQRNNWWEFRYDKEAVMNKLGSVRAKQGLMLGRMQSMGFDFQDEAMLTTMSLELVRSCEIEGEVLNLTEVRSSIARRRRFGHCIPLC